MDDYVPEWARYRAVDLNGDIFLYETEPVIRQAPASRWCATGRTYFCGNLGNSADWTNSKKEIKNESDL